MITKKRSNTQSIYTQWYRNGTNTWAAHWQSRELISHTNGFDRENPCSHIRCKKSNAGTNYKNWNPYMFRMSNSYYPNGTTLEGLAASVKSYLLKDFWIIDPNIKDNKFNILMFLAEWDSTLALFTTKLLKTLLSSPGSSYAVVEWGFKQLISDITSLCNSIKYAAEGPPKPVKINKTVPVSKEIFLTKYPGLNQSIKINAVIRYSGQVEYFFPSPGDVDAMLKVFLDEVGFHPDLSTLWDLVPLSFVVNWFIPIGAFIQKLHPRGWAERPAHFVGRRSVKGHYVLNPRAVVEPFSFQGEYLGKVYTREPYNGSVSTDIPDMEPDWKCPTLDQIATTIYVALLKSGKI